MIQLAARTAPAAKVIRLVARWVISMRSPGPANISERVRAALTLPDIGHRDSEFRALLRDVRAMLLEVCGVTTGYTSVILTGSGTTGIESSLTALKMRRQAS